MQRCKGCVLAVLIASIQLGCAILHPASESGFAVKGTILTNDMQPTERCMLDVYRAKGNRLVKTIDVAPKFEQSVVIGPGEHEYYLVLRCDGTTARFRSKVYRLGRIYYLEHPIDLGDINLTHPDAASH
jgi:hypothetical protein